MSKIIIMNGAAGTGKDYLGKLLNLKLQHSLQSNKNSTVKMVRAKDLLFKLTADLFNIDPKKFLNDGENEFYSRKNKELPNPLLTIHQFDFVNMLNESKEEISKLKIINQDLFNLYSNNGNISLDSIAKLSSILHKDNIDQNYILSPREALIFCSEIIIKPIFGESVFGDYILSQADSDYVIVTDGGFIDELLPLADSSVDEIIIVTVKRKDDNGNYMSFKGDSRNYLIEIFNNYHKIIEINNFYNKFLANEQDFINKISNIDNNNFNRKNIINSIFITNKIRCFSFENEVGSEKYTDNVLNSLLSFITSNKD